MSLIKKILNELRGLGPLDFIPIIRTEIMNIDRDGYPTQDLDACFEGDVTRLEWFGWAFPFYVGNIWRKC